MTGALALVVLLSPFVAAALCLTLSSRMTARHGPGAPWAWLFRLPMICCGCYLLALAVLAGAGSILPAGLSTAIAGITGVIAAICVTGALLLALRAAWTGPFRVLGLLTALACLPAGIVLLGPLLPL